MGTGGFCAGVKWQEREADLSPPTIVEVKKLGSIYLLPQYVFMA
jgi:hypothetical protein